MICAFHFWPRSTKRSPVRNIKLLQIKLDICNTEPNKDNNTNNKTNETKQSWFEVSNNIHGRWSWDNRRKSFTPELVQSFTAKVMFMFRQTITAKVSHQNWCKVSQQKSWSYVVRQSPQKFHTRTGAKFHSKSHVCMSSDNHRKSFTPELVQSIAAKVMFVFRQTITVKVSHQNWCKVSQQKSWSYVVRQSPQKFHTRTGAKFHSKSHGCTSWDNHRGRKLWSSDLQGKCW